MNDLGGYRVPREAEMGREVRFEQRRSANRTALFALGGILFLCACMTLGVCGLSFGLGLGPFSGNGLALNLSLGNPTPTRASVSRTPTLVPYGRGGRSDAGLSVTVTAYQRPLPTEGIDIPDGQELVLVSVRLENTRTTGAPIKYDPADFALVSPEGDHFTANLEGITTGENLKAGEVAPGKSARGDLIFYIWSDVPDLQLAWTSADGKTRLFQIAR
jgi:hypothetical protein